MQRCTASGSSTPLPSHSVLFLGEYGDNNVRMSSYNSHLSRITADNSWGTLYHIELSLRRTPSGPAATVRRREVSAYREFRYSKMTEKWLTGTNTRCPFYRGVHLREMSVKRELTLPICHFRNKKQSEASRISQSLVGLLLGMRRPAGRYFVPSNVPQATARCDSAQIASRFCSGEWFGHRNLINAWYGHRNLIHACPKSSVQRDLQLVKH